MIRNYTKFAWRNIVRNRTYATIKIAGLSLGLGLAIVIFCFVRFERGFDMFHTKADRLYKLISYDTFDEPNTHVPQGVINALRERFPGVEKAATVYRFDPSVIRVGEQNFKQENAFFIHTAFFDMIDVEWVHGSPEASLSEPYQVILDEPTAQRLFLGRHRITYCVVGDEQMVAGLCVSHRHAVVDVRRGGAGGRGDCAAHRKLAGDTGGDGQSGGFVEG